MAIFFFNEKAVWLVRESDEEAPQSVDDKAVLTTNSKPGACALMFPPLSVQASKRATAEIEELRHYASHLADTKSVPYVRRMRAL